MASNADWRCGLSAIQYLPENTRVTFELRGHFPLLREQYVSPQAGTVTLKGFLNPAAHLELLDGTRYRTLAAKRDEQYRDQMAYQVISLPDKTEMCRLRTLIRFPASGTARWRYTATLDGVTYVVRQAGSDRREIELWNGVETQKLVRRQTSSSLIPDLDLLAPVPTLLVLLFPWFQNLAMTTTRS
jgi:hypothetical protein